MIRVDGQCGGDMSLYEALDGFVGAGVLAAAGLVGVEMPPGIALDGVGLSRFLRERRQGDEIGQVLDVMAHEVWLAQERRGFPLALSEAHATGLAMLLGEIRIGPGDLAPALANASGPLAAAGTALVPQASNGAALHQRLAEIWIGRAKAAGHLARVGLVEDVARFLMEQMFRNVVEQPRLLVGLKDALAGYRTALLATAPPPHAPTPASSANVLKLPTIASAAAPLQAIPPPNIPQPTAVAQIRSRHNLPEGALRRFQTILGQHAMSAEHRLARLDELAGWLTQIVAQLRKPGNDAADVRRLKADAASALENGELELAMDLLKSVRELVREGRRRAEARIAEEMQALKAQMIDEANATARLGELALARLDYGAAADHFADAAGDLPAGETALELDYRQKQAEALASKAELTGEARALEAAAQAFRVCRRLASRADDPAGWARINVGLADMLMALGARDKQSSTVVQEAAASFAEAAGAVDRAAHPMQWALVQLSHAAALVELGARINRDANWKAAATALMQALEVFESRGATDLAEAARGKLRLIATGLQTEAPRSLIAELADRPFSASA